MNVDNHPLLLGGLVVLTVIGLIGITTVTNSSPSTPETVTLSESFEDTPNEWHERADVPPDPNTNGTVDWSISPTDEYASDGNTSMLYQIDGNQDDGTIWLRTNLSIQEGYRYNVTMSVDAWSRSESFNKLAQLVMRAGTSLPEKEEDFPQSRTRWTNDSRSAGGLRADLDEQAGWKTYEFTWQTPELQHDQLVVAVGISVIWETQLAYPIDSIQLEAEPLPS